MRKRNIYLLCAITFLQGMVFYAAVATLYRQAAGLSVFQITAIEGISVALSMALEIPWRWASAALRVWAPQGCSGWFVLNLH